MSAAAQNGSLNYQALDRDLDRAKTAAFLGKTAAFLGSILCSLEFHWSESLETAGVNEKELFWNPNYFNSLPPESRKTDLMHELWHVGKLHAVRKGSRDHKTWNIACDIHLDLMLRSEGYSFDGIEGVLTFPWLDCNKYIGWVEEDIYDDLVKLAIPMPNIRMSLLPGTGNNTAKQHMNLINLVQKAIHQANISNQAGSVPGNIGTIIKKYLTPVVPWEQELQHWMTDMLEDGMTWTRPNRRYLSQGMYLPSRHEEEGRLAHLVKFWDVSGSVSDKDEVRFNSEFRYVWDTFQPKKLTLCQFDTIIQSEVTYEEDDSIEEIKIIGRGGTDLEPVRQWINEHQPTAAVIFSDLYCDPMEPLDYDIPVLWVCVNHPKATVPFGRLIHIR